MLHGLVGNLSPGCAQVGAGTAGGSLKGHFSENLGIEIGSFRIAGTNTGCHNCVVPVS